MQQRRDTAANWTANNPTLSAGEIGFETNTGKFKIGDGATAWNSLAYAAIPASGAIDLGGATSFEIPNSAAPTVDADGEIALDTSVADFSHGIPKIYGGEELAFVVLPVAELTTPTDGHVIAYNATNDEFELVAASGVADGDKGDITVSSSGTVWTIDNGAISDAKVASGIDAAKIANGTVSNTEFQYLNGVSSALQTQIDGKSSTGHNHDGTYQPVDADLTAIAALSPSNDDIVQRKAGAWTNRTMAQVKTDLALAKGDVGLGNVDNTSDANKPISTATQTALDLKAADSAVVHDTGDETVAGIKTFSSSPIVPAPTTDLQAATKKYVDDAVTAGGGYTDEAAQDAVGGILTDSAEIDLTYNDATPSITASIVAASIDETKLDASVNTSLGLADSSLQPAAIGSTVQGYDADLAAIAALAPSNDDFIQRKTGAWTNRTVAQVKTDLGLTGTNSGDQTSIVGISGTLAEFNTAISDANLIPEAGGTFTGDISVPDEVYDATAWNGSLEVPTKNAIRDKIESMTSGGLGNVVEDTTPQLGGDLDANTFNIGFDDATGIEDDSGNEQLIFQKTASAVNHVEITNAATGTAPQIAAAGDDANVDLILKGKGTGTVQVGSGTATGVIGLLDTDQSHYLNITPGSNLTANRTLTLTTGDANRTVTVSGDTTLGGGSHSGTNTGDQTTIVGITGTKAQFNTAVSDGNIVYDGDALGTPSSGTLTNCTGLPTAGIVDDAVTYAKLQNISATSRILGRITSGAGNAEELTPANVRTIAAIDWAKGITVESPTSSEDLSIFFTEAAITVTKMVAVLVGSSTPSVTWTIRHSTDRSATGNEVVTSGTTTTSTTTGSVVTSFNDATIPANSFVWLETTAQSGTVGQISITLIYTKD